MKRTDPEYPVPSSEAVSRVMRANRKRDTRPECRLRAELHRSGLRYRKNAPVPTPIGSVRPDIVFTRARLAVFVDGCFWHSCPMHGNVPATNGSYWTQKLTHNRARDEAVDRALDAAGWTVLRIWEHETVVDAAEAVRRCLSASNGNPSVSERARRSPTMPSATVVSTKRERTGGGSAEPPPVRSF